MLVSGKLQSISRIAKYYMKNGTNFVENKEQLKIIFIYNFKNNQNLINFIYLDVRWPIVAKQVNW